MRFIDKWKEMEGQVTHASPNLLENYRRCFYMGAMACMALMESTDLTTPDAGMSQMKALVIELQNFGKEMMDGQQQQRDPTPRRKEF